MEQIWSLNDIGRIITYSWKIIKICFDLLAFDLLHFKVFILHYCGVAYFESNKYEEAISIYDCVINNITQNRENYNINLGKECNQSA